MAYMIWDVENAEEVDTYVNNYFETREEAVAFLNQMIEDGTGYYPFREEDGYIVPSHFEIRGFPNPSTQCNR